MQRIPHASWIPAAISAAVVIGIVLFTSIWL